MYPLYPCSPLVRIPPCVPKDDFLELEEPSPPFPSPWDPSYLLYLECGDLPLEKEWLPELKDIQAVKDRLNGLVRTEQGGINFHNWVTEIAKILEEEKYSIGLYYSISGSSISQVLGCEWLEYVTERIEIETGRSLAVLKGWIKTLTFHRNDIDARIEIIGADPSETEYITKLLKNRPNYEVVEIKDKAVLLTYENWDLVISVQNGRNFVFDADAAAFRIPFEHRNQFSFEQEKRKPQLEIKYPIGFYNSHVFGVADMSDSNLLNNNMWRVICYRSICGKRLLQQELLPKIFNAAANVTGRYFKKQIQSSFKKHAMPENSHSRMQFLVQLILDCPYQQGWHAQVFEAHVITQSSIWSRVLSLHDRMAIQSFLLWLGYIALRERWNAPLEVLLSEREKKCALRLEAGDKTVWLAIDDNSTTALSQIIKDNPQKYKEFWSLLQAVPWKDVQRKEPSAIYDSELKPILPKLVPLLATNSPLERFLYVRQNAPIRSQIDWEKVLQEGEKWESAFVLECIKYNECELFMVKVLPYADSYSVGKALHWRCRQPRTTLLSDWLEKDVWELLIKSGEVDLQYNWIMYCGQVVWLKLEENLKSRILKALTSNRLSIVNEVSLLEFAQAPVPYWEKVLKSKEASSHASLLLRSTTQLIPNLANRLHPLALACFKDRQKPREAVLLLDHWINIGSASQALILWGYCNKSGLLENWTGSWKLLSQCGGLEDTDFQLLACKCTKEECPDLDAWAAAAPSVLSNIHNFEVRRSLLRLLQPTGDLRLLLLFIETKPPLDEVWESVCLQDKKTDWSKIYDALVPSLLEAKDSLWLQRAWKIFMDAWPKGGAGSERLKLLIGCTLKIERVLPEFETVLFMATQNDIEGVVGSIPLIIKAIEGGQFGHRIQLLHLWEKWLCDKKIPLGTISVAEHPLIHRPLSHLIHLGGRHLKLLYESRAAFVDAPRFILGLISNKRGSYYLGSKNMFPWLSICVSGFSKANRTTLTIATRRMMHVSLITSLENYGIELEAVVTSLILSCSKDLIIEVFEIFIGQLIKSIRSTKNLDRLERYLFHIMSQVPANLEKTDKDSCKLILRAAEACHLLTIYRYEAQPDWRRSLPIIRGIEDLRIRRKFVVVVGQWIENTKGYSKIVPDSFVKASLLINDSQGAHSTDNMAQLLRCVSETSLWAAQETDKFPKASSWFNMWLTEIASTMGEGFQDVAMTRFIESLALFFFPVQQARGSDSQIFRGLIRAWGRMPWQEARAITASAIWERLKVIRNDELAKYLLVALKSKPLHCEKLIKEMECEIKVDQNNPKYKLDLALSFEERQEEFKSGAVLQGIRYSKNIAVIGALTLSLSPIAGLINNVAGRSFPVLTYVQRNGIKVGFSIVTIGMAGMTAIAIASVIFLICKSIFPSPRN